MPYREILLLMIPWAIFTGAAGVAVSRVYAYERLRKTELTKVVDRMKLSLKNGNYDRTEIVRWQMHIYDLINLTPESYKEIVLKSHSSQMANYEAVRDASTRDVGWPKG
jgi:hypothetical protein